MATSRTSKTGRSGTSGVQSVLLPKTEFPTRGDARRWLVQNDFRADKIEDSGTVNKGNYWRARQHDPDKKPGVKERMFKPSKKTGILFTLEIEPKEKSASAARKTHGRSGRGGGGANMVGDMGGGHGRLAGGGGANMVGDMGGGHGRLAGGGGGRSGATKKDPIVDRRVEISPRYDLWMRGAKYGTVNSVSKDRKIAYVRMDHPGVKKFVAILVEDLTFI